MTRAPRSINGTIFSPVPQTEVEHRLSAHIPEQVKCILETVDCVRRRIEIAVDLGPIDRPQHHLGKRFTLALRSISEALIALR